MTYSLIHTCAMTRSNELCCCVSCCSVLQCACHVAVCCSVRDVLQICCSVHVMLRCVAVCMSFCSVLQCACRAAMCCSAHAVLQVCCSVRVVLQVCCRVHVMLHCVAVCMSCCTVLQCASHDSGMHLRFFVHQQCSLIVFHIALWNAQRMHCVDTCEKESVCMGVWNLQKHKESHLFLCVCELQWNTQKNKKRKHFCVCVKGPPRRRVP